jgi:tetratricopeptide (TPR) repeat protein
MNDFKKALEYINAVIIMYPKNIITLNLRGFLLTKAGNYADALADLNRTILLFPKAADSYLLRGKLKLEHLADKAGACNDFRKAKELGSDSAPQLIKENCQ